MGIYEELIERGLIAQVTDENEIKELNHKTNVEKEKINEAHAKIERYKEQLSTIINNREFDLLSKEIEFDEKDFTEAMTKELEIMRHYAPYIEHEKIAANRAKEDEKIKIPKWLNYDECTAVRYESREKLKKYLPETLAQAARIPGVNPADVAVLAVIIKRGYV